jgi:hypothetical protein
LSRSGVSKRQPLEVLVGLVADRFNSGLDL